MDGICCGDLPDVQLDEGCSITKYPIFHDDQHRKRLVRVASPQISGVYQPTIHHDCSHNQLRAATGRVMGVVPKPSTLGKARLKEVAEWVGQQMPLIPPQDLFCMPNRYSGAKRKRYMEAAERFLRFGVRAFDAVCTMFVKPERFDGHAKHNPDPRAIQFRSSVFCVALAQYLQPIEHHIYEFDIFSAGVPPSRNIAKGLNSSQRAELLRKKLSHFRRPVVLSLDASRFDKHVAVEHLQAEHHVYRSANKDWLFWELLRRQYRNRVKTNLGLEYIVVGRRMSGDMNTAVGNCLIMLMMVKSFCRSTTILRWDTLDDGDDCLLIIEDEDLDRVLSSVHQYFLEFGMVMKVESVARSLFEVVFCQSSVVEYADARFKFVRDYKAVISKSLCGVRHWQDPNYRIKVLRAIGLCELVLNLGVPVLQSFACCVLRNVGRPSDIELASDGLRNRVGRELRSLGVPIWAIEPQPVAECARESFAQAFGCDRQEQLDLEKFFDGWTFNVEHHRDFGPEWDVASWLASHSTGEVYLTKAKCQN